MRSCKSDKTACDDDDDNEAIMSNLNGNQEPVIGCSRVTVNVSVIGVKEIGSGAPVRASRILCLVRLGEKVTDISPFSGSEVSAWWTTPRGCGKPKVSEGRRRSDHGC